MKKKYYSQNTNFYLHSILNDAKCTQPSLTEVNDAFLDHVVPCFFLGMIGDSSSSLSQFMIVSPSSFAIILCMCTLHLSIFSYAKVCRATYNCPSKLKHAKCWLNILLSNLLYLFKLDPFQVS